MYQVWVADNERKHFSFSKARLMQSVLLETRGIWEKIKWNKSLSFLANEN